MGLAPRDLGATELDPALARTQEAEDGLHQGRLAGAVGADDGDDLALADDDGNAIEDVGLGDVAGDHAVGLEDHLAPGGALVHALPPFAFPLPPR